jgi:DNA polymerase-3 subunit gamma/tau
VKAEEPALHLIAEKADGGLRDSLSLFDQLVSYCDKNITYAKAVENLNILDKDFYFKIMDSVIDQDMIGALNYYDEIVNNGFEGQLFLNGLSEHLRNLMVSKDERSVALLETDDLHRTRYLEQAKTMDMGFLINGLNILNRFDLDYKTSNNKRLHVELALIKLSHIRSLVDSAATLEELKKKVMN